MRETPHRKQVRELFVRDLVPAPGAARPAGDSQVTSLMVGEEKDDGGTHH